MDKTLAHSQGIDEFIKAAYDLGYDVTLADANYARTFDKAPTESAWEGWKMRPVGTNGLNITSMFSSGAGGDPGRPVKTTEAQLRALREIAARASSVPIVEMYRGKPPPPGFEPDPAHIVWRGPAPAYKGPIGIVHEGETFRESTPSAPVYDEACEFKTLTPEQIAALEVLEDGRMNRSRVTEEIWDAMYKGTWAPMEREPSGIEKCKPRFATGGMMPGHVAGEPHMPPRDGEYILSQAEAQERLDEAVRLAATRPVFPDAAAMDAHADNVRALGLWATTHAQLEARHENERMKWRRGLSNYQLAAVDSFNEQIEKDPIEKARSEGKMAFGGRAAGKSHFAMMHAYVRLAQQHGALRVAVDALVTQLPKLGHNGSAALREVMRVLGENK